MDFALHVIGYVFLCIGHLWVVILAWQKGILWGIGCLIFPLVGLIYVVLNWKEAKSAFLVQVAGFAVLIVAEMLT
jgi:hypothetical protein